MTSQTSSRDGVDIAHALQRIQAAVDRCNLIGLIDPSGRGGSVFFQTIFDRHPEVACCPLVVYSYSYFLKRFGNRQVVAAKEALDHLVNESYFRLIYNEPVEQNVLLISRFNAGTTKRIDRAVIRTLIDAYFVGRQHMTRREVLLVQFVIWRLVQGFDINRLKYALVSDAISARDENVVTGFRGGIVDEMVSDFPEAHLIRLVRDVRATFASPRHQFVNALGNMYALSPSNYLRRLRDLLLADLRADNGCIYLYWLLYLRQSALAMQRMVARHPDRFLTVRNEDLNINFVPTMAGIAHRLGIEVIADWRSDAFEPTIAGEKWGGIGAYNTNYQHVTDGLLKNDEATVSANAAGPNRYVTERWRKRLSHREIALIERLFKSELDDYGYDFVSGEQHRSLTGSFARNAMPPFLGELPTLPWLREGARRGLREFGRRLFYALTFPPFYLGSRVLFAHFIFNRRIFD